MGFNSVFKGLEISIECKRFYTQPQIYFRTKKFVYNLLHVSVQEVHYQAVCQYSKTFNVGIT